MRKERSMSLKSKKSIRESVKLPGGKRATEMMNLKPITHEERMSKRMSR